MSVYDTILPDRPIRISKTGIWPGIFHYLFGLMFLALAGFIGFWQAPGIVNDWLISQDPVTVEDALITDGECMTRQAVFVDCSGHVAYEIKGKTIERDIELMFLDFGSGDYLVDVVRSSSRPERVTLSLGLDMLWNRILTGLAFVAGIAAIGVGLLVSGARADRNRKLASRPSKLTALPVPVTAVNKVVGGKYIQFQYGQNSKNRPLLTMSRFKKSQEPFWLEADGTYALAVLPEQAKLPILLDADLERLDLPAIERAAIKAKLEALFAAPDAVAPSGPTT